MAWESRKKASYVSLGELKLICGVLSQVLGGQIEPSWTGVKSTPGLLFTGCNLIPIKRLNEAVSRIQREDKICYNFSAVIWIA